MYKQSEKVENILCGLFSYNPKGIKYAVAFASLLWGVTLLLPNTAYLVPLFAGMESLMAEEIWGILFLFHGVFSLFSTINNRKDIVTFILDSIGGMILWTTATVALVVSSKIVPAHLSAQVILSLCTLWLFIRFNLQKE